MSYILDALKKAEAERDPQARVSLAMDSRDRQRHRLIQYLVVAALLVNAGVLAYVFAPKLLEGRAGSASTTAPSASTPPAPAAAAAASDGPAPGTPQQTTPLTAAAPRAPADSAAPAAVVSGSTSEAELRPEPRSIPKPAPQPALKRVALSDLPADARSRFPGLSFSTHLYSSDSDLRAVVVNGQRLQEGDRLGVLTLKSITEDGVIFRFENYLVTVSVLDDWN